MFTLLLTAIASSCFLMGEPTAGACVGCMAGLSLAFELVGDWTVNKIARNMVKEANDEYGLDLHDWTDAELAELDAELNG